MRVTSKRVPTSKKPCVYVSYLPDDPVSTKIATYIKQMLLDEYDVPGVVLEPEDGRLNYIDFDMKMKVMLYTDLFELFCMQCPLCCHRLLACRTALIS